MTFTNISLSHLVENLILYKFAFYIFFFISNTYLVRGMKAREGSRHFSDSKKRLAPGGSLAKIKSAPRGSMLKIKSAPTGVLQKITWRSKG